MTIAPPAAPDRRRDTAAGSEASSSGEAIATAETPTVRGALRQRRTWIVFALVLVIGSLVLVILQGGFRQPGPALGADNPAPIGAKALVEVLRAQGVEVTAAGSLAGAVEDGQGGATVLLYDELGLLDRAALLRLADAADRLVVVAPNFAALEALAPGVRLAGAAIGPLDHAGCDLPVAERAAGLSDAQSLVTVDDQAAADGWIGCFPDGDAGFALATGPGPDGGELAIVGAPTIFANDTIDLAGNAALALGLTGASDELVWYLPGPADIAGETAPTLGELTPGWLSPVIVLGLVVGLAAAVWRGRRFGPLVVEDLPVEVPSAETSEGRARLYARSASRVHALDQLRIGTVGRLAALLRLPRSSDVGEVVLATAAATGRDPVGVGRLLVTDEPTGDGDLVDHAGALAALEFDVRRSLDPDAQGAPAASARASEPSDPTTDPPGRRP